MKFTVLCLADNQISEGTIKKNIDYRIICCCGDSNAEFEFC